MSIFTGPLIPTKEKDLRVSSNHKHFNRKSIDISSLMVYHKSMNKSECIKDYEIRLHEAIKSEPDEYIQTGQISGSKISQPTLTAILTMLGINRQPDDYVLGKFTRGHDVEEKFIERTFDKNIPKNDWHSDKYHSHYYWQYEIPVGYRGCTCSIDLLEKHIENGKEVVIVHEIKSVSKMKYDRVCGTGYQKNKVASPEPDYSHCLQASLYALSLDKADKVIIHYINADDYRVTSFIIHPENYKDEIDKRIDAIYMAFATKILPKYIPYEAWQKGKYNDFEELEKMSEEEVNNYIKTRYPEAWEKFLNAETTEKGINYETN